MEWSMLYGFWAWSSFRKGGEFRIWGPAQSLLCTPSTLRASWEALIAPADPIFLIEVHVILSRSFFILKQEEVDWVGFWGTGLDLGLMVLGGGGV